MKPWIKKWTAGLCALLMLLPAGSLPAAAAQPVLEAAAGFPADLARLEIPEVLGTVEEALLTGGPKTVILVQDAHAVPEAQNSIRKLIHFFQKEYGLRQIAFEGASGTADALLLKSFPDTKLLKQTLRDYHDRAELSGVSAAMFFDETNSRYFGIEDWQLFEEGIGAYREASKVKPALTERLAKEKEALEQEKKGVYSPELLEFDRLYEDYARDSSHLSELLRAASAIHAPPAGAALEALIRQIKADENSEESLRQHLRTPIETLRRQKKIWTADLNRKVQAFETGELSAGALALELRQVLPQSIVLDPSLQQAARLEKRLREARSSAFYHEMNAYFQDVINRLITTPEQERLQKISRRLMLNQKLISLELTREDWDELKADTARLEGADAHRAFYRNAEARENVFVQKMFEPVRGQQPTAVLFVAGGFHAHALAHRLRQQNIRYLLITPKINSLPDESRYAEQMAGGVSWKSYFRIEKGRVSLRDAFFRAVRDDLLKQPQGQSQLKRWRDELLRALAQEGRLAQAGEWTRFLDEVMKPFDGRETFRVRLSRFIDGLRGLERGGQLTETNILDLLKKQTAQVPAIGAQLTAGNFMTARLLGLVATDGTDARSEVRSYDSESVLFDEVPFLSDESMILASEVSTQEIETRMTTMWNYLFSRHSNLLEFARPIAARVLHNVAPSDRDEMIEAAVTEILGRREHILYADTEIRPENFFELEAFADFKARIPAILEALRRDNVGHYDPRFTNNTPEHFLSRVISNALRSARRKDWKDKERLGGPMMREADRGRSEESVLFDDESTERDPADSAMLKDLWGYVHDRILPQLNPPLAQVFSKHYFDGMTLTEIAEETGITRTVLKDRLLAATNEVGRLIEENEARHDKRFEVTQVHMDTVLSAGPETGVALERQAVPLGRRILKHDELEEHRAEYTERILTALDQFVPRVQGKDGPATQERRERAKDVAQSLMAGESMESIAGRYGAQGPEAVEQFRFQNVVMIVNKALHRADHAHGILKGAHPDSLSYLFGRLIPSGRSEVRAPSQQEAVLRWKDFVAKQNVPETALHTSAPIKFYVTTSGRKGWQNELTGDEGLYGKTLPPFQLEDGRMIVPVVGDFYEVESIQSASGDTAEDAELRNLLGDYLFMVKNRGWSGGGQKTRFLPGLTDLLRQNNSVPGFPSTAFEEDYNYAQGVGRKPLVSLLWILKEKNRGELWDFLRDRNLSFDELISWPYERLADEVPASLYILSDNLHWEEYYRRNVSDVSRSMEFRDLFFSIGMQRATTMRPDFVPPGVSFAAQFPRLFELYEKLGDYLAIDFGEVRVPSSPARQADQVVQHETLLAWLDRMAAVGDPVLRQELERRALTLDDIKNQSREKLLAEDLLWARAEMLAWQDFYQSNSHIAEVGAAHQARQERIAADPQLKTLYALVEAIADGKLERLRRNWSVTAQVKRWNEDEIKDRLGLEILKDETGRPFQTDAYTFRDVVGRLAIFYGESGFVEARGRDGRRQTIDSPAEFFSALERGDKLIWTDARLELKGLGALRGKLHKLLDHRSELIYEQGRWQYRVDPASFLAVQERTEDPLYFFFAGRDGQFASPQIELKLKAGEDLSTVTLENLTALSGMIFGTRYQPGFPSPSGTEVVTFSEEVMQAQKRFGRLGGVMPYHTLSRFLFGETRKDRKPVAGSLRLSRTEPENTLRIHEAIEEFRLDPQNSLLGRWKREGVLEDRLEQFYEQLGNNAFALFALGKVLIDMGTGRYLHMGNVEGKTLPLDQTYDFFKKNVDVNSGSLADLGDYMDLKTHLNDVWPEQDWAESVTVLTAMAGQLMYDLEAAGILEVSPETRVNFLRSLARGLTRAPDVETWEIPEPLKLADLKWMHSFQRSGKWSNIVRTTPVAFPRFSPPAGASADERQMYDLINEMNQKRERVLHSRYALPDEQELFLGRLAVPVVRNRNWDSYTSHYDTNNEASTVVRNVPDMTEGSDYFDVVAGQRPKAVSEQPFLNENMREAAGLVSAAIRDGEDVQSALNQAWLETGGNADMRRFFEIAKGLHEAFKRQDGKVYLSERTLSVPEALNELAALGQTGRSEVRAAPEKAPSNDAVIQDVLAKYGIANATWAMENPAKANILTVTDDGGGKWLLKNPYHRTTGVLVDWEASVLEQLGAGAAQIQKNNSGKNWTRGKDKKIYVLYEYVEGRQYNWGEVDGENLETAARWLALMHKQLDGFTPAGKPYQPKQRPQLFQINDLETGIKKFKAFLRSESLREFNKKPSSVLSRDDIYNLGRQVERLENNLLPYAKQLPETVVHGDFHQANFRYQPDGSVRVFDFEYALTDARIRDLANALTLHYKETGESFDFEKIRRFIEAYHAVNPLTETEIRVLPEIFRRSYLEGVWLFASVLHGQLETLAPLKEQLKNLQRLDMATWKDFQQDLIEGDERPVESLLPGNERERLFSSAGREMVVRGLEHLIMNQVNSVSFELKKMAASLAGAAAVRSAINGTFSKMDEILMAYFGDKLRIAPYTMQGRYEVQTWMIVPEISAQDRMLPLTAANRESLEAAQYDEAVRMTQLRLERLRDQVLDEIQVWETSGAFSAGFDPVEKVKEISGEIRQELSGWQSRSEVRNAADADMIRRLLDVNRTLDHFTSENFDEEHRRRLLVDVSSAGSFVEELFGGFRPARTRANPDQPLFFETVQRVLKVSVAVLQNEQTPASFKEDAAHIYYQWAAVMDKAVRQMAARFKEAPLPQPSLFPDYDPATERLVDRWSGLLNAWTDSAQTLRGTPLVSGEGYIPGHLTLGFFSLRDTAKHILQIRQDIPAAKQTLVDAAQRLLDAAARRSEVRAPEPKIFSADETAKEMPLMPGIDPVETLTAFLDALYDHPLKPRSVLVVPGSGAWTARLVEAGWKARYSGETLSFYEIGSAGWEAVRDRLATSGMPALVLDDTAKTLAEMNRVREQLLEYLSPAQLVSGVLYAGDFPRHPEKYYPSELIEAYFPYLKNGSFIYGSAVPEHLLDAGLPMWHVIRTFGKKGSSLSAEQYLGPRYEPLKEKVVGARTAYLQQTGQYALDEIEPLALGDTRPTLEQLDIRSGLEEAGLRAAEAYLNEYLSPVLDQTALQVLPRFPAAQAKAASEVRSRAEELRHQKRTVFPADSRQRGIFRDEEEGIFVTYSQAFAARKALQDYFEGRGAPEVFAGRLADLAHELVTNILDHGEKGTLEVQQVTRNEKPFYEFEARDFGPGIEDLNAMDEKSAAGRARGHGLRLLKTMPGITAMEVESQGKRWIRNEAGDYELAGAGSVTEGTRVFIQIAYPEAARSEVRAAHDVSELDIAAQYQTILEGFRAAGVTEADVERMDLQMRRILETQPPFLLRQGKPLLNLFRIFDPSLDGRIAQFIAGGGTIYALTNEAFSKPASGFYKYDNLTALYYAYQLTQMLDERGDLVYDVLSVGHKVLMPGMGGAVPDAILYDPKKERYIISEFRSGKGNLAKVMKEKEDQTVQYFKLLLTAPVGAWFMDDEIILPQTMIARNPTSFLWVLPEEFVKQGREKWDLEADARNRLEQLLKRAQEELTTKRIPFVNDVSLDDVEIQFLEQLPDYKAGAIPSEPNRIALEPANWQKAASVLDALYGTRDFLGFAGIENTRLYQLAKQLDWQRRGGGQPSLEELYNRWFGLGETAAERIRAVERLSTLADEGRGQMASLISHVLRNSLNAVSMSTGLMQRILSQTKNVGEEELSIYRTVMRTSIVAALGFIESAGRSDGLYFTGLSANLPMLITRDTPATQSVTGNWTQTDWQRHLLSVGERQVLDAALGGMDSMLQELYQIFSGLLDAVDKDENLPEFKERYEQAAQDLNRMIETLYETSTPMREIRLRSEVRQTPSGLEEDQPRKELVIASLGRDSVKMFAALMSWLVQGPRTFDRLLEIVQTFIQAHNRFVAWTILLMATNVLPTVWGLAMGESLSSMQELGVGDHVATALSAKPVWFMLGGVWVLSFILTPRSTLRITQRLLLITGALAHGLVDFGFKSNLPETSEKLAASAREAGRNVRANVDFMQGNVRTAFDALNQWLDGDDGEGRPGDGIKRSEVRSQEALQQAMLRVTQSLNQLLKPQERANMSEVLKDAVVIAHALGKGKENEVLIGDQRRIVNSFMSLVTALQESGRQKEVLIREALEAVNLDFKPNGRMLYYSAIPKSVDPPSFRLIDWHEVQRQARAVADALKLRTPGQFKTIFVAEDLLIPEYQFWAGEMQRTRGIQVVVKPDGQEGLDALMQNSASYDLIISDVNMPHLTGPAMMNAFSDTVPQAHDIPAIFVTDVNREALEANRPSDKDYAYPPVSNWTNRAYLEKPSAYFDSYTLPVLSEAIDLLRAQSEVRSSAAIDWDEESAQILFDRVRTALEIPQTLVRQAVFQLQSTEGLQTEPVTVEYAAGLTQGAVERVGPLVFVQYLKEEDVPVLREKIGFNSPNILFYPPMDMKWARNRKAPHPDAAAQPIPFLSGHTSALAALAVAKGRDGGWEGKTAADFYAGRGILGLVALRLGAERVYNIESDGALSEKAKEVFRVNGYPLVTPTGEPSRAVFIQKAVHETTKLEELLPARVWPDIQEVISHAGPAYPLLDEKVFAFFNALPQAEHLWMGGYGGGQAREPQLSIAAAPDIVSDFSFATHLLGGEQTFMEHMTAYRFSKAKRSEVRSVERPPFYDLMPMIGGSIGPQGRLVDFPLDQQILPEGGRLSLVLDYAIGADLDALNDTSVQNREVREEVFSRIENTLLTSPDSERRYEAFLTLINIKPERRALPDWTFEARRTELLRHALFDPYWKIRRFVGVVIGPGSVAKLDLNLFVTWLKQADQYIPPGGDSQHDPRMPIDEYSPEVQRNFGKEALLWALSSHMEFRPWKTRFTPVFLQELENERQILLGNPNIAESEIPIASAMRGTLSRVTEAVVQKTPDISTDELLLRGFKMDIVQRLLAFDADSQDPLVRWVYEPVLNRDQTRSEVRALSLEGKLLMTEPLAVYPHLGRVLDGAEILKVLKTNEERTSLARKIYEISKIAFDFEDEFEVVPFTVRENLRQFVFIEESGAPSGYVVLKVNEDRAVLENLVTLRNLDGKRGRGQALMNQTLKAVRAAGHEAAALYPTDKAESFYQTYFGMRGIRYGRPEPEAAPYRYVADFSGVSNETIDQIFLPEETEGQKPLSIQALEAARVFADAVKSRTSANSEVRSAARVTAAIGAAPVIAELERLRLELSERQERLEDAGLSYETTQSLLEDVRAKLQKRFASSDNTSRGYDVTYVLPQDPERLYDFVQTVTRLGRVGRVLVHAPGAEKLPADVRRDFEDRGIQVADLRSPAKTPVFLGDQSYSGLIAGEGQLGIRPADSLIPVIDAGGLDETDPFVRELMLTLQTAVALLVAEKGRPGMKPSEIYQEALSLLKDYELMPGFESRVIRLEGTSLVISASGIRDFAAEWAALAQTRQAA